MKLFFHLYAYLLSGLIILVAIAEYLAFLTEVEQFQSDMIAGAVQDGRIISGMVAHVWTESGEKKAFELIEDASLAGSIRIRWQDFEAVAQRPGLAGQQEELDKLGEGEAVTLKMAGESGELYSYTFVPVKIAGSLQGALELRQTLSPLHDFTVEMFVRALIITILIGLFSGFVLYVFMSRKIGRPLKRLMAHARRIGQGDFTADTRTGGSDELAVMAETMNDMCSRLLVAKEKIKFEYDARLKTLEQLRHTERLSSFGLISAGIAHELGTPLNVVDGRAKMILNEDLDREEIKECAGIIKNQADRMTSAIRQLLDFTRRPQQQVAPENIALLIKQVFQLLHPMAARQRVRFSLHVNDAVDPVVRVDGSQIQQVLVNLLMNGIQAMPGGGEVKVDLVREEPSQTEAGHGCKYLRIRIHDEGEGINEEHLENIFTPFFTTKKIGTGTGLGLSIAHGIVDEHGGWIEVESKAGCGACFSVYLPRQEWTT